jgi:hypothetical protein
MVAKQYVSAIRSPDGSAYVTLTDGAGNLSVSSTTSSPYPVGATPVTASATGTTSATAASLPGVAAKTTYICGFTINAAATAAVAGTATVTGTVSGTLNFYQGVGVATAPATLSQTFNPPIPASAVNTAITVTSAAAGTGGVTAVSAWGYQL